MTLRLAEASRARTALRCRVGHCLLTMALLAQRHTERYHGGTIVPEIPPWQ
jgi:hypothetical protein